MRGAGVVKTKRKPSEVSTNVGLTLTLNHKITSDARFNVIEQMARLFLRQRTTPIIHACKVLDLFFVVERYSVSAKARRLQNMH